MPIVPSCGPNAADRGGRPPGLRPAARGVAGLILALAAALLGCAPDAPPAAGAARAAAPGAAAPAAVQPVPFDEAVLNAANTVFSRAPAPPEGGRRVVVIDPLVDGVTGEQSVATRQIQRRIMALVAERYPRFEVRPFSPATVANSPLVLVGTFTPVNARGQPTGDREALRFCLVLADLRSGRTVAKGVARALPQGVDSSRTAFFRDSPAWTDDPLVKGYINTCQATQVGDPIDPIYLNGIQTAAIVSEAIEAYEAGRYRDALDLYRAAQNSPAGEQLRVYNGVYLASWKLGRRAEATEAFGRLVDRGLANNRLAMMFLFGPGSAAFVPDERISGPYGMWLRQIAGRSAARGACLQATGHTSKSGSAALNERLSQLRADYVRSRLEGEAPAMRGRVITAGAGSQQTLIGTGADDTSDALDRRVEFKVVPNC